MKKLGAIINAWFKRPHPTAISMNSMDDLKTQITSKCNYLKFQFN